MQNQESDGSAASFYHHTIQEMMTPPNKQNIPSSTPISQPPQFALASILSNLPSISSTTSSSNISLSTSTNSPATLVNNTNTNNNNNNTNSLNASTRANIRPLSSFLESNNSATSADLEEAKRMKFSDMSQPYPLHHTTGNNSITTTSSSSTSTVNSSTTPLYVQLSSSQVDASHLPLFATQQQQPQPQQQQSNELRCYRITDQMCQLKVNIIPSHSNNHTSLNGTDPYQNTEAVEIQRDKSFFIVLEFYDKMNIKITGNILVDILKNLNFIVCGMVKNPCSNFQAPKQYEYLFHLDSQTYLLGFQLQQFYFENEEFKSVDLIPTPDQTPLCIVDDYKIHDESQIHLHVTLKRSHYNPSGRGWRFDLGWRFLFLITHVQYPFAPCLSKAIYIARNKTNTNSTASTNSSKKSSSSILANTSSSPSSTSTPQTNSLTIFPSSSSNTTLANTNFLQQSPTSVITPSTPKMLDATTATSIPFYKKLLEYQQQQQNYHHSLPQQQQNNNKIQLLLRYNNNSLYEVDDNVFTIGNHPQNNLYIQDDRVAQFHCSIFYDVQSCKFVIKDTSTNGTIVNKQLLKQSYCALLQGMQIILNQDQIIVVEDILNKTVKLSEYNLLRINTFYVQHCYSGEKYFLLQFDNSITIGTSSNSTIKITDDIYVSREQVKIQGNMLQHVATSMNPTLILRRDQKIDVTQIEAQSIELQIGDVIVIGKTLLQFAQL